MIFLSMMIDMDLGSGGIRIGLDIGGGSGSFAAMMHGREKFHPVDSLGEGGHQEKMEFLMFDIDRVLRAGGLFWLDNFHCVDEEKKMSLTRVIGRFGYKKLKWVVGEKIVSSGKSQVYLSAVLQKPPLPSMLATLQAKTLPRLPLTDPHLDAHIQPHVYGVGVPRHVSKTPFITKSYTQDFYQRSLLQSNN
ncbi:hypothetical protein IFM89_029557 [Coptis chinensis]|uniref:Uncharacterized protein n=1 Tax=Coptis chinensis TaxID=261450 RepID=A0A835GZU5_9MAGN|nr:hypothetical protein IFM89_029557 [Coptis chinensis]